MHFGIDIPNFGSDYADVRLVAEVACEAEDAGWDGFFILLSNALFQWNGSWLMRGLFSCKSSLTLFI